MTNPFNIATIVLALCLVGCNSQPTMKITSADDVQPEIKRVSEKLEPTKAAEFKTAAEVLILHAAKSATTEAGQMLAPAAALNGKTPDAVISEYNKLDPEFRRQTGTAIAEARMLKPINEHMANAQKRYAELEGMQQKYDQISFVLSHTASIHMDKEVLHGKLAAAKWYDEELALPPEKLVEKYGGDKGFALREESRKAADAKSK